MLGVFDNLKRAAILAPELDGFGVSKVAALKYEQVADVTGTAIRKVKFYAVTS
jgi:hypothetical protein